MPCCSTPVIKAWIHYHMVNKVVLQGFKDSHIKLLRKYNNGEWKTSALDESITIVVITWPCFDGWCVYLSKLVNVAKTIHCCQEKEAGKLLYLKISQICTRFGFTSNTYWLISALIFTVRLICWWLTSSHVISKAVFGWRQEQMAWEFCRPTHFSTLKEFYHGFTTYSTKGELKI